MKIVAIIQARMSSTRLPGKVLKEIAGKPMLGYVVDRTRWGKMLDSVVVATTKDALDDPIANFCKNVGVVYYRGSMNDVLWRYKEAAKRESADVVVRVTSDCPLIDGNLIDEGIRDFLVSKVDYLSNTVERTFPRGFDFEVFTFKALYLAYKNAKEESAKEHVTPYIWRNHPEDFKIKQFRQKEDKSVFRITVDTPEDFEVIKILIENYQADLKGYREIIQLLENHPEIVEINKNVEQKHYGE